MFGLKIEVQFGDLDLNGYTLSFLLHP